MSDLEQRLRRAAVATSAVLGAAVGLLSESVTDAAATVWVPDLAVGLAFVGCGLIATERRPNNHYGMLMVATGLAWFLPNFASVQPGWLAWPGWPATRCICIGACWSTCWCLSRPAARRHDSRWGPWSWVTCPRSAGSGPTTWSPSRSPSCSSRLPWSTTGSHAVRCAGPGWSAFGRSRWSRSPSWAAPSSGCRSATAPSPPRGGLSRGRSAWWRSTCSSPCSATGGSARRSPTWWSSWVRRPRIGCATNSHAHWVIPVSRSPTGCRTRPPGSTPAVARSPCRARTRATR